MKRLLPLSFLLLGSLWSLAQCEAGEVEIQMNLYTDPWGYEVYWEIVPSGEACGVATIEWGGNIDDVGCDGGGQQDAGGNGYPNNSVIELEPFCLTEGEMYDLIFVDDWGDGGLTFEIFEDGALAHLYVGGGSGSLWTFEAGNPGLPENDSPCFATPIDVDADPVVFSNENAIAQIGEVAPGGGSCWIYGVWCEGSPTNSIWASFVAPDAGTYRVNLCHEETTADTQVAVYSFDDCADQASYGLISANDDAGCGVGNYWSSICYVTCLEPGTEYLVQMDGWNGSIGDFALTVETWEGDVQLFAGVNNIPCALNKGEDGTGFIMPSIVGWGSNFTAEWTGPDGFESTDNFIFNLEPGTYVGEFTSPCGDDVITEEWEILNPAPFDVSFDVSQPECPMSGNGTISMDIGGATPPYTTFWTGPDDFQSDQQALTDLGEGLFTVFVTDNNGCQFEQNINIEAINDFSFSIGSDTTLCLNDDLLLYGPPGYIYQWQDGSINQFFEVDAGDLGTGIFSFILNAQTLDGCEFTDALILTIDDCITGVDELVFERATIYPNPTTGQLWLQGLPAIENGNLEVFDSTGKMVHSITINTTQESIIELNLDVEAGLYTVRLSDGQGSASTQIIVH